MRQEASIAGRTYESLMVRLAALQEGVGPSPAVDSRGSDAEELMAAYRRRVIKAYFGCGLVTSLIVGCAALLPTLYAQPGASRLAHVATVPLKPSTPTSSVGPDVFELSIRTSERTDAPFPLRISGTESSGVVLRNVPERAWLSRGERQDEHTWLLRASDLADLRIALRAGAPDAFDVTVDVASAGDQITRSIARVRLADDAVEPERTAAPTDKPPTHLADAKSAPERGLDTPFRTSTKAVPHPPEKKPAVPLAVAKPTLPTAEEASAALLAAMPAGAPRVTRPEGMSTLGALPREPSQDARQLWWKMPAPSWAPFPEISGR